MREVAIVGLHKMTRHVGDADGRAGSGEGLVRAMRKVPPLFFQEHFSLSRYSAVIICADNVPVQC